MIHPCPAAPTETTPPTFGRSCPAATRRYAQRCASPPRSGERKTNGRIRRRHNSRCGRSLWYRGWDSNPHDRCQSPGPQPSDSPSSTKDLRRRVVPCVPYVPCVPEMRIRCVSFGSDRVARKAVTCSGQIGVGIGFGRDTVTATSGGTPKHTRVYGVARGALRHRSEVRITMYPTRTRPMPICPSIRLFGGNRSTNPGFQDTGRALRQHTAAANKLAPMSTMDTPR